jgi:hypothetical protein
LKTNNSLLCLLNTLNPGRPSVRGSPPPFSLIMLTTVPYTYLAPHLPGVICIHSTPEAAFMDNYIQGSLEAGFIRPSTSTAGAGFFFMAKKDGGLCPYLDYRGLNQITIKSRYPYS